jgi:hypothetical protein
VCDACNTGVDQAADYRVEGMGAGAKGGWMVVVVVLLYVACDCSGALQYGNTARGQVQDATAAQECSGLEKYCWCGGR